EAVLLRRHRAIERVGESAGREHCLVKVESDVARSIRRHKKEAANTVGGVAAGRVGEDDPQGAPRLAGGERIVDAVLAEGDLARNLELARLALVFAVLERDGGAR